MKCNLSKIMGEKRIKISYLARATNINRGTLTRMYYDEATRVELDVIERLCNHLGLGIGDLYEIENSDA